jgi:hypothetical protein
MSAPRSLRPHARTEAFLAEKSLGDTKTISVRRFSKANDGGAREVDPGDTRIISVRRVSIANDGGAGGCKSISTGKESQDFRGRAAGKRMRTRSSGNKANENPCLVDFSTSEGIVNLPPSDFLESMLFRRWQ